MDNKKMEKWEEEYELEEQAKHKLAEKIWDIPFAVSNLEQLTKKELLMLIPEMLNKIGLEYEPSWIEMDIKDFLLEQKCWLIEALDKDFFKKGK